MPPNWSRTNWLEEVRQIGWAAGWKAVTEFDPDRGVRLDAFAYLRIMAAGRTRYRQEWGYGIRSLRLSVQEPEDCEEEELAASGGCPFNHPAVILQSAAEREAVREVLALLPESDRLLVAQLFWQGHTEAEVGARRGRSQRAINKRKQAILQSLRSLLISQGFAAE